MSKSGPFIGITCRSPRDLPAHPDLYRGAVKKAGGTSVFIPPESDVKEIALFFDGFIIPGGGDPDPSLYNEVRSFGMEIEDRRRIDFELTLLREIISLRKPALGICYGMQLINVYLGGSLYQDIGAQIPGALKHEEEMHPIIMGDNPFLNGGKFAVNSRHHEAVKDPGEGVIPLASAPDGIMEAFYLENYGFLLGVQWHPERIESPLSTTLFRRFIEECSGKQ